MSNNAAKIREQIAIAKEAGHGKEVVELWAMENLGMTKSVAKNYVKSNWDKENKLPNTVLVRNRITEAKQASESQDVVIQWAMDNLGMTRGVAGNYVRCAWDHDQVIKKPRINAAKLKEPKLPKEPKAPKTPKVSRALNVQSSGGKNVALNNLSDVKDWLESIKVGVTNFDGTSLETDLGKISMAFGDFFVTKKTSNVIDGRPETELMSPKHFKRFVLGDTSKIGFVELK